GSRFGLGPADEESNYGDVAATTGVLILLGITGVAIGSRKAAFNETIPEILRGGHRGCPATTVGEDHMAVPLLEADRVAAGQVVSVVGQGVDREREVGQRAIEEVRGQKVSSVWPEATHAHVQTARASVRPLGRVPERVDRRGLVGVFALAEGAVALAVGRIAVAGWRVAVGVH